MVRVRWWKPAMGRIMAALPWLAFAGCGSLAIKAERRGGDVVTQWTLIGDYYGNGAANWRTRAIMQMAMHDALNAAHPVYRRWWPATAGEPAAEGANPEVAMATAADEVLLRLHPEREADTTAAFVWNGTACPAGPAGCAGRQRAPFPEPRRRGVGLRRFADLVRRTSPGCGGCIEAAGEHHRPPGTQRRARCRRERWCRVALIDRRRRQGFHALAGRPFPLFSRYGLGDLPRAPLARRHRAVPPTK